MQGTKDKLEKIVADMKKEGNPNAVGVESEVNQFVSETLDKIIEGAKTASEAIGADNNPIGNIAVAAAGGGAGAAGDVKNLIKGGIKGIVDIVLKNEGNAEAGDDKNAEDGNTSRTANNAADNEAGKLFASNNAGDSADKAKKSAADAAKAVGAVTGADILQAIIKDSGNAAKLAANNIAQVAGASKDATIAGGMALRAMAKDGKFANASANDAQGGIVAAVVKGAAVSH